jgi:hypothetical protein
LLQRPDACRAIVYVMQYAINNPCLNSFHFSIFPLIPVFLAAGARLA